MKRIILTATTLALFCMTTALAQSGPKRDEKKPKADSTAVKKSEKPEKPETQEKAGKLEKPEKPGKSDKTEKQRQPETSAMSMQKSKHVARALFTTVIAEREPVGKIDTLSTSIDSVYFFSTIVGMEGQTVTHRWMHRDEVVAEVPITVGAAHWRAYSMKRLLPSWTGVWTVEVVDAEAEVLTRRSFVYVSN